MTILPKRNKRRLDQEGTPHSHHTLANNSGRENQPSGSAGGVGASSAGVVGNSSSAVNPSSVSTLAGHASGSSTAANLNVPHSALYQTVPLRLETHRSSQSVVDACSSSRRNRKSPPIRSVGDEGHQVPSKKRRKHTTIQNVPIVSTAGERPKDAQALAAAAPFAHIPSSSSSTTVRDTSQPSVIPAAIKPKKSTAERMATITSHMLPGGSRDTADRPRSVSPPQNNSDDEYHQQQSPGGCNSEDEYTPLTLPPHTEELEQTFERAVKKELGLTIKQMETDGSCLFRAVADQVYGDQDMHDAVRAHCIDYMAKNADHFSHYVTEDYNAYLRRKKQLGCHGNHIEVQALSEMYNRPIEVYQYSLKPINIFNGPYSAERAYPIRLSYHRNTHYNSLVDPNNATIGVGLGLPGFQPGLAERNLVSDAVRKSEELQLEQTMLHDKIRETDWERTDEAIQEEVARASYLQWLQDCQKRDRRRPACTVTGPSCSGSEEQSVNWGENLSQTRSSTDRKERTSGLSSPKSRSNANSPKCRHSPGASSSFHNDSQQNNQSASVCPIDLSQETKTFLDFEPHSVYGYNDKVDENEALARAIAESQQDYLSQLRKSNH